MTVVIKLFQDEETWIRRLVLIHINHTCPELQDSDHRNTGAAFWLVFVIACFGSFE